MNPNHLVDLSLIHRRDRTALEFAGRDHPRNRGHRQSQGLQQALQNELTPGGAVALLVFAFAMQCMSTNSPTWPS
jgi:hypothetical protein